METRDLIILVIGAVLIGIGLPLFYIGRYLSAPEEEKKKKARDLKGIALLWMAAGVLIYLGVLLGRFVF